MKRWIKLIASAIFVCFFVIVSQNFLHKTLSFALCTLLGCNQATVYSLGNGDKVNAALPPKLNLTEWTDGTLKPTYPLKIAAPPIIRDAPVDLQQSFPIDFSISRQTPNSTGRNEILFVSPSTGTEQRFEINLPGTGAFQLYSAKFNKVSIGDPNRLIKNGSTLTATQAQQKLSSFEIKFNNNIVSEVILADGTKAEVSNTEVIVKQSDGQIIETLPLSQDKSLKDSQIFAQVKSNTKFLAQADSGCQSSVQQNLYQVATQVQNKSNNLKSLESDYGYLFSWALTFGDKALEDSLVDNSRNITIQEIACTAPVQCQQAQASGGSEVRTDLFELPSGTNRKVTFDYEFYDIPDRVEIYYNGEIKDAYPQPVVPLENTENPNPAWLANGNGQLQIAIDDDKADFIGIKMIGNDDEQTKWDYTVNCTGEAIAKPLGLDRWWTTAGSGEFEVNWRFEIAQKSAAPYYVQIIRGKPTLNNNGWELPSSFNLFDENGKKIEENVPLQKFGQDSVRAILSNSNLEPGKYDLKFKFSSPQQSNLQPINFWLSTNGQTVKDINAFFIADYPENNSSSQNLIAQYAPILYFDNGEIGSNQPEQYSTPVAVETTWNKLTTTQDLSKAIQDQTNSVANGDSRYKLEINTAPQNISSTIYASIVRNNSGEIAINYYFHYPNSNWKDYGGYNNHDGDWEGITVFLNSSNAPQEVAYSQHVISGASSGGVIVPWQYVDKNGVRPKVYVGLGGHASYPFSGITGWFGGTTANNEFHKGDLYNSKSELSNIEYLPRAGSLDLNHEYSWLLFPGTWGKNGETPPRGPIFQNPVFRTITKVVSDIGLRWLDPWTWKSTLFPLKPGRNDDSSRDQIIYIGKEQGDKLIIDEKRSILRGNKGNDTYQLESGIGEEFKGSFVEDIGGNDKLSLEGNLGLKHTISLDLPKQGKIGLHREQNNLIIDTSEDGLPKYLDDVTILNFFDESGQNPGTGFIEQVDKLSGQQILEFFRK